ncbi:MAG TPA: BON domain-containing protein, partial [Gemmataceae bacterium]|nr:BON domain-containing protein [Gemmataceae bacterium]
ATVLGKNVPIVNLPPTQLQGELLNSLQQSTFLTNKAGVLLKVDGSTVYLKGQVANEDERRIVEGFVRMTPGVRNVVNELVAPVVLSSNQ